MRTAHVVLLVLVLGAVAAGIALWLQDPGTSAGAGVERGPALTPGRATAAPQTGPVLPPLPERGGVVEAGREGLAPTSATSASAAISKQLRGRVIDQAGQPVPGARVVVSAGQRGFDVPIDLIGPDARFGAPREETQTAEDGTFRVARVQGQALRVAVRKAGFAPLRKDRERAGDDGELGDLVLESSVVLEGRVFDDLGRALPEVEVHVLPMSNAGPMMFAFGGLVTRMTVTDAEGGFRLDELAAGPYALRFDHARHPEARLEGVTDQPGEHVTGLRVELKAGYEVRGWVRGLDGVDPAELLVRAREMPEDRRLGFDFTRLPSPRNGQVATDGSFVVSGLREERSIDLAVVGQNAGPWGGERSPTVQAKAGDRGVELTLRAEAALTMLVVDARTQQPIEAVRVEAGGHWRAPQRDAEGKAVEHHPGGRVRYAPLELAGSSTLTVRVTAEGYEAWADEGLPIGQGQELDLGVIALVPAPVLEVRVTTAGPNTPIEGALVRLVEVEPQSAARRRVSGIGYAGDGFAWNPSGGEERSARTDAEGVARVTALVGRSCTLSVSHDAHVAHVSEPFLVAPEPGAPIEVALGRGGTVVVRVVDPQGAPLEGVALAHRPPEGSARGPRFGRGQGTDNEGLVTFEHLAPGTHGFRIDEEGAGVFGRATNIRFDRGTAVAPEGPTYTEVLVREGARAELQLTAPERGVLGGRVLEGGRPLAGAALSLQREESDGGRPSGVVMGFGGLDQATSGGDGRFAFRSQSVGRYRVTVTHAGRAMPYEAGVTLDPGGTELILELPLTSISGTVKDFSGRPMEGARVRAEAPSTNAASAPSSGTFFVSSSSSSGMIMTAGSVGQAGASEVVTDDRGRYELRGVREDVELIVHATADGDWQPARSAPVRARLDENLRGVDLVLQRGGALLVTVLRADGSPGTPALLTIEFAGEADPRPGTRREFASDPKGTRIGGLLPGKWRVRARPTQGPGGRQAQGEPVEVEVGAGDEVPLTVRVP